MRHVDCLRLVVPVLCGVVMIASQRGIGQESELDADVASSHRLATRQEQLADKYQRLEMLMLKMAEFDATSHPQRSTLLKQALTRSKDNQISQQMLDLVALLRDERLKQASIDQAVVRHQLSQLLELLLSENRADRLRQQQDRVQDYIKQVERLLRQQRGVQGRTEGGDDTQRLAQDQANIADRTERLAEEIDDNERPAGSHTRTSDASPSSPDADAPEPDSRVRVTTSDGRVIEGKVVEADDERMILEDDQGERHEIKRDEIKEQQETNASDEAPSTNDSSDSPQAPSQDQPSDGKPSDGKPSDGKPSDGKPSDGKPSEGGGSSPSQPPPDSEAPPAEVFPGQQQIQRALKHMRDAQQRLEETQRNEALPSQQEARRLLEEAKSRLEEILRQMREEEIERALAQLESRFRKMLEMQIRVYEDTQQLSELKGNNRAGQIIVQSGKLSVDQRRIAYEADKTLLLLREEGSSVAFPEAVEQMREDMEMVVDRLGQAKIDMLTLGLEEDIITALEEIVEALQKALQDAEQRRQQLNQQSQSASPKDMPLVDAIAELKMIRALQMRVNRRTDTYAQMLADPKHTVGQATDGDLIESLEHLSRREARIHQITRDIILEKNK